MQETDQVLRAHGNDVVVAQLEKHLEEAKKGKVAYAAVAFIAHGSPLPYHCNHFGDSWLEQAMPHVLEELIKGIEKHLDIRTLPAPTLTPDHVTYNVPTGPMSYDSLVWLINAEMNRIREGAPAPLKVHFWHGKDQNPQLDDVRAKMYYNVAKPALRLLGAIEENQEGGWCEHVYTPAPIVKRCRGGEKVPKFKAPDKFLAEMREYSDYVTITLREAPYWPHRNSNLKAWSKFAKYLTDKGEKVVFVRDTDKADEPFKNWPICPMASHNLMARAALYEVAKVNLFVSNGPVSIAMFNDKPWLEFVKIEPDGHTYHMNTPWFWRQNCGLEVGEQYPWSSDKQRIVWDKKDDLENLIEAWDALAL